MDKKKECAALLRQLREDYKYKTPDIFTDESEQTRKIKWIVENKLDTVDSTIFLLYVECASLRKLGELLNCSHSTVRPVVAEIKNKIKNELAKMEDIKNI